MKDKKFDELSMSEKFTIQKIVRKKDKGEALDEDEQELFDLFGVEFATQERAAKSKLPIIIGLLISSLIVILRKCNP